MTLPFTPINVHDGELGFQSLACFTEVVSVPVNMPTNRIEETFFFQRQPMQSCGALVLRSLVRLPRRCRRDGLQQHRPEREAAGILKSVRPEEWPHDRDSFGCSLDAHGRPVRHAIRAFALSGFASEVESRMSLGAVYQHMDEGEQIAFSRQQSLSRRLAQVLLKGPIQ